MAAAKSRSFSTTAWVSKDVMGGKLRPIETCGLPDGSRGIPKERDQLVITGDGSPRDKVVAEKLSNRRHR
jgi:hypothetical protein